MAETDLILAAQTTLVEPSRVEGQVGPLTTTEDGRLRVASKPGYFPSIFGDLTTSGNTLVANVTDASNLLLHLKNTGSAAMAAGVFAFEGSIDSTDGSDGTWFSVQSVRTDGNTIETGRAASSLAAGAGQAYAWELSVNAIRWFRIRCTTTVTASSIATWTIVRGTYATEPIPAIQAHSVSVSNSPTVSVSAVSGSVTTVPSNNSVSYTIETAASTNAATIKAGLCSLYELTAYNPTATVAFLKLYNKASAPTVGTDVPVMTIPIAANGLVALNFGAIGKRFPLGVASAVTALAPKTDTGVAVAGIQISMTVI